MIPNHWYPILETQRLKRKPIAIQRMGQALVVFRGRDGGPRCLLDRCPHRGVALSLGRVRGNELECRYHGLRFNGRGQCTRLPCEGPSAPIPRGLEVSAFELREAHGLIWMWWGIASTPSDRAQIPWFDEWPSPTSCASEIAKEWPVDFIRAGEGMFDVYHAPFVHRGFIPRVGTRVGPVEIQVDGDRLEMRGSLEPQPGSREQRTTFRTRFVPPSLSLLQLGDEPPLYIADCPIDADRTWRFARQSVEPAVRVLGLGRLQAWLNMAYGWYVLQELQDRPIVRSQASAGSGEKLLRPDVGILRYRRVQRRRLRQALADSDDMPAALRRGLLEFAQRLEFANAEHDGADPSTG